MKSYFQISKILLITCLLFSCEETVFETDISAEQVNLIAPSDGAILDFTSINFNWSELPDADQYQLDIATPDFDNPDQILVDVLLDSITQYDATLTPNQYQWRVKALNSAYETSYASASFQVINNDNFPGNVVSLITPEDNLIVNSDTFTLQWMAVQDATLYRIQIIDNQTQLLVEETTSLTASVEYTFEEGNYLWQVRAERDAEVTLYSQRNILIDQTAPNPPSLLTPEDESVLSDPMVNFTWERTPIEGSVEIDSLYIYQDANLSTLIEKQQVDTSYGTTLDTNTAYYWLMKTFDAAGNESLDGPVFSFTIN